MHKNKNAHWEMIPPNCDRSQNSQQKSVPNLNVLTVAFLALKKMVFLKEKKNLPFFNATFQCRHYGVFKKLKKKFFDPKKGKNGPQKLLIISPDPFFCIGPAA